MPDYLYKVRDWVKHFENHRTRKLKKITWIPIPNQQDGDGYTELVKHPNGAAHLGAWLAILQVASKCEPRGILVRRNGARHDSESLGRISGISEGVIREALGRLSEIGWLEMELVENTPDMTNRAESRDTSPSGVYGREGNGREGNNPLPPISDDSDSERVSLESDAGASSPEGDEVAPEEFVRFWKVWPSHERKTGKAKCIRAWRRLKCEGIAETVIAGLERWKASSSWTKENGAYIPGPQRWLNERRWEVTPQSSPKRDDVECSDHHTPQELDLIFKGVGDASQP